MLFSCSGLFFLGSLFRLAVRSRSPCGIRMMIALSAGMIYLNCCRVTTENSRTYVFFLNRYDDSIVLVTLIATVLLSTLNVKSADLLFP